jgi:hypothetical protein
MSKYRNTSGLGKADWLWANLKQNPEGLLLLAAGGALLLRRGSLSPGTQDDSEYMQDYPAHRESMADHMLYPGSVGDEANEASRSAEEAREHASSLGKTMNETARDYAAAASEHARAAGEKLVEQSRQLADKAQSRVLSLTRERPLAVALAGLAAGAALAAAFPSTRPERRVLGPARQRLYEAAEIAGEKISVAAGERLKGGVKEDAVGTELEEPASGIAGEQKSPALGARSPGSFAAESGTDQIKSDSNLEGEECSDEAKAAKAILDAQQKAVDDIRAGRPAPYYFTAPQSTVPSPDTARSSINDPDPKNE